MRKRRFRHRLTDPDPEPGEVQIFLSEMADRIVNTDRLRRLARYRQVDETELLSVVKDALRKGLRTYKPEKGPLAPYTSSVAFRRARRFLNTRRNWHRELPRFSACKTAREFDVVHLLHGSPDSGNPHKPMTQAEISRKLVISRQRVHRILAQVRRRQRPRA